jgi:hypothetical protein
MSVIAEQFRQTYHLTDEETKIMDFALKAGEEVFEINHNLREKLEIESRKGGLRFLAVSRMKNVLRIYFSRDDNWVIWRDVVTPGQPSATYILREIISYNTKQALGIHHSC